MQVIICGAGMVGSTLASYLTQEGVDVTLIDNSPEKIEYISTLDVAPVLGNASHPNILKQAGAEDADMIIAATDSDEINIVICQIAHTLFLTKTKIARIRAHEYLEPKWAGLFTADAIPADGIISPDIEIARNIMQKLQIPSVSDVVPLANDTLRIVGITCTEEHSATKLPYNKLTSLLSNSGSSIAGIVRKNQLVELNKNTKVTPGDKFYAAVNTPHFADFLETFGLTKNEQKPIHNILILGGGRVTFSLARILEIETPDIKIKVIENNKDRAEFLAINLKNTIVLHGDMLDAKILMEANISHADVVITATSNDEINILASLLAKHMGIKRTITRTQKTIYDSLLDDLGLGGQVNQRTIMISTILHHIHHGIVHKSHFLDDNLGELVEMKVQKNSDAVGIPLKNLPLPRGSKILSFIRSNEMLLPSQVPEEENIDTITVNEGDRIIMFAKPEALKDLEELFNTDRLGYF
ncbi:MAG: Trk system potassium transporter TrkA [Alphaproteobacteria bacterium]|nr:Trk system potassium transporter TrkA [Alphaproteobacteria bacterium]